MGVGRCVHICVCLGVQYVFYSEYKMPLFACFLYLHVGATPRCPSVLFAGLQICVSRRGQERHCGLYKSPWINYASMEEEEGWVSPGPAQCAACSAPQCSTTPSTIILSSIKRFMDWCRFPVPLILAMFSVTTHSVIYLKAVGTWSSCHV